MKLLIIEDEKKIADSIKKGLEQEKFVVDIAYNGDDGYDLALSEPYDALVLDLMLPGMNGIEICKNLRKNKVSVPILMLTAKGYLDDKVTGLNTGADDYLTKPFEFDELVARLKAITRRPKEMTSEILECNGLKIDTTNLVVTREGKKIELSRKEYDLLEYLLRNKNKMINKDEIINNVWEFDSDILPNTVEVYIGYLRNKIDKPFSNLPKLIKTYRGFGYKVCDER